MRWNRVDGATRLQPSDLIKSTYNQSDWIEQIILSQCDETRPVVSDDDKDNGAEDTRGFVIPQERLFPITPDLTLTDRIND